MRNWTGNSHSCSSLMTSSSIFLHGTVPQCLSPLWSGRDKASLHKAAGRTGARVISGHSTCQQSHRTPGTHSPIHRLPAPIFFSSFHLLIHSFILAQHFPLFSISYCVFSYFSLSPFTTHSPSLSFSLGKWCILLSSCLLGTHWKAGRASSAVLSL